MQAVQQMTDLQKSDYDERRERIAEIDRGLLECMREDR